MNYLRSCAGCSAHIIVGTDIGEMAWCARCRAKHVKPFDEWAKDLMVGSRVYLQPIVAGVFARSEWIIREIDSSGVSVSVLGMPDRIVHTTVAQLAQHCLARRIN